MVRDDTKLVVISGGVTKPVVKIFSASGMPFAAFMWDHGRIMGMGWTNEEDLLIVEDIGEVCAALLKNASRFNVHCTYLEGQGVMSAT